jgi:hypothetical protein
MLLDELLVAFAMLASTLLHAYLQLSPLLLLLLLLLQVPRGPPVRLLVADCCCGVAG